MVKRAFMIHLWRIQQSQALLGLVLWGLVITFTSYPVVSPVIFRFLDQLFGIQPETPGVVLATLLLLFGIVMAILSGFGLIYDKYLKLWREQTEVAVERNPYAREKLLPKEILTWRHMLLPVLRSRQSSAAMEDISFMEHWIERSLEDPRTRKAVEETQNWIERKS